jgi:hypothetical protein
MKSQENKEVTLLNACEKVQENAMKVPKSLKKQVFDLGG